MYAKLSALLIAVGLLLALLVRDRLGPDLVLVGYMVLGAGLMLAILASWPALKAKPGQRIVDGGDQETTFDDEVKTV